MSAVEFRNATRRFSTTTALDDVSLQIADGEFFGLLGPSGSGKTTLLRAVAGLEQLDSGTVLIDEEDVTHVPVHMRDIGMVFQNYALFPHMSVFDNVAFGLSVRGKPKVDIATEVDRALSLVELDGFAARKPRQLSGGQQQRVALARALVTRPRVLLLDEPLGALDKRLRSQMQIELSELQRSLSITSIFVTHDQEEALSLCDRLAIFNEGKVVQLGKPKEIYERPNTVFAANFLGDANFFNGKVETIEHGVATVRLADGRSLRAFTSAVNHGDTVTIAVRPEKAALNSRPPPNEHDNVFDGELTRTVYTGNSVTYFVRSGDLEVSVFERADAQSDFKNGQSVSVGFNADDCVLVSE